MGGSGSMIPWATARLEFFAIGATVTRRIMHDTIFQACRCLILKSKPPVDLRAILRRQSAAAVPLGIAAYSCLVSARILALRRGMLRCDDAKALPPLQPANYIPAPSHQIAV